MTATAKGYIVKKSEKNNREKTMVINKTYENNGVCDYLLDDEGNISQVTPLPETAIADNGNFKSYISPVFKHPYYVKGDELLFLSVLGISKIFDLEKDSIREYIERRYRGEILNEILIYSYAVIRDTLARFDNQLFEKLDTYDKVMAHILGVLPEQKTQELEPVSREDYNELLARVERLEAEISILSHLISDNK